MSNEIIQDYSKTITPESYNAILRGHQYIAQSDYCIESISKKFCGEKPLDYRSTILDVGCGPGRITMNLGLLNSYVVGVDIASDFIKYALNQLHRRGDPSFINFQELDFTSDEPIVMSSKRIEPVFDVIVMQGVMHHVHGQDRGKFLQRSSNLLKPDGIIIIGDEFIANYTNEDERILNVFKFYLHIIDEAKKGGFDELAEEEAKNLIDDCFSGTQYAGHGDEKVFEFIYEHAHSLNHQFYMRGSIGTAGGSDTDPNLWVQNFLNLLKTKIEQSSYTNKESFNRGNFKISAEKFIKEVETRSFTLKDAYKFGPVDELGGMGVLVFKKY